MASLDWSQCPAVESIPGKVSGAWVFRSTRTPVAIVFDNGAPRGVSAALQDHTVEAARSHGWDNLGNGELLDAAEAAGFDVLLTTDRNIRHQQNLTGRKIAIVVLGKGRWRLIKKRLSEIAAAVASAAPGSFPEVDVPDD